MRLGDLVQHKDPLCGWGVIIDMQVGWIGIEVLWLDGKVEFVDSRDVEVINAGG